MSVAVLNSSSGIQLYMQQVFNTFSNGVLVEDADRKILMVNKPFLDLFGVPADPEDMVGYDCSNAAEQSKDLFKDPGQFIEDVSRIPIEGKEQEDLVELVDGRFFLRKYSPIYEDGMLTCHVWHYEEKTSLKQKDEEMLAQKEFFKTILNEIPADIAIFSPKHKYLYLNKLAIKNEGIRNWLIGKDDYEYCAMRGLDTRLADERRAKFNECKRTRQSVSWVDELTDREGNPDYVLRIFYPYINSKDELEFVIGYGVNITKQKEHELILAQEKERFSTLIGTLNDGVFQMTFDGRIQLYNQSFLKAMGLHERLPEQYSREVMRNVFAEDKSKLYAAYERLQKTHKPQQGTFRVKHPLSGDTKYIEYYIWYRHTQSDGDVGAGRLSDVTERVMREEQMQTLINKEKELNNMKSHFIHITSHELRTPLSVILSSAEILDMINGDDEQAAKMLDASSMTNNIVREVNRITTILNELLLVGRIESGQAKYEPEVVNLPKYIKQVAAELFQPYKDDRIVQLDIADDVCEAYLDASLMRYAIINLLSNAFKYSKGKEVPQLSVFIKSGKLHMRVKDHGIGIPKQDLPKLFNSFYRASNVGNISGTGIGLMVVQHVAKVHKGNIDINSKQGEGSVITLTIPLSKK